MTVAGRALALAAALAAAYLLVKALTGGRADEPAERAPRVGSAAPRVAPSGGRPSARETPPATAPVRIGEESRKARGPSDEARIARVLEAFSIAGNAMVEEALAALRKGDLHECGIMLVRRVVENGSISSADLRFALESLPEGEPKRPYLVLGLAYSPDLSREDLRWIADGVLGGAGVAAIPDGSSRAVEAWLSVHALALAGASEEVERVALGALDAAVAEGASETSRAVAAEALRATDGISLPGDFDRVLGAARSAIAKDAVRTEAWRAIARSGAGGARHVLDAVLRGEPIAAEGLPGLRDPAAAGEVAALLDRWSIEGVGDHALGLAARGLLSIGGEGAIERLRVAIAAGGAGSDASARAARATIAAARVCENPDLAGDLLVLAAGAGPTESATAFESGLAHAAGTEYWARRGARPTEARLRASLRRGLSAIPPDAGGWNSAFYYLAVVGDASDVPFLESALAANDSITENGRKGLLGEVRRISERERKRNDGR